MNPHIFDRSTKLLQRNRLLAKYNGKLPDNLNYLKEHVAKNIAERMQVHSKIRHEFCINKDVKRHFENAIDIGGGSGIIHKYISPAARFKRMTCTDMAGINSYFEMYFKP